MPLPNPRPPSSSRPSARYARLIAVCRARGCSLEDARDVVQEAHLRLFQYQRTAAVADPAGILRRIVINISINRYHGEQSAAFASESIESLDRRGALVHPGADPERALAAEQELAAAVRRLSAANPRAWRIYIAQRGGYSYEEIAAAFALKLRTVEKHVATAALAAATITGSATRSATPSRGRKEWRRLQ